MTEVQQNLPPGWHVDPDTGAWMRDTIHKMGRRCRNWDYCGTGVYLITLVLTDRSRPLFGQLARDRPEMLLSELGRAIERHFLRISEFTPEIEVLGVLAPSFCRDWQSGITCGAADSTGTMFA